MDNLMTKGEIIFLIAPKVSAKKHQVAIKIANKIFFDMHDTKIVAAMLLATMLFTVAFTLPGSCVTKINQGESKGTLGLPIILGLDSFKVFLIFYCVALFLSLFVVFMWQMNTPITIGDKIFFLCFTNLLVCATFDFTTYRFMDAVYAMLDKKNYELALLILGACVIIFFCGNFTLLYMAAKFSVKKA